MDREERKELIIDMKAEVEEYGEEWAYSNFDNRDYWLDCSYKEFEKFLVNENESGFLLPKDYDAIYDNCGVDFEDFEDLFLENKIFEWAAKSAYNFLCNWERDKMIS